MRKALIILAVTAGILTIMAISLGMGFIGFQNTCKDFEIQIEAQYTDNQNVYDNGYKEVLEKSEVPEMYTDQLKELYSQVMSGRYGEEGSKALFQFIQEQNPTLDAEIFRQIQQSIETFRRRFTQAQRELVAKKQAYQQYYAATTSGRFYNMLGGYPKADMARYDIVTSGRTEETFSTKKDEPLKLR
ncbi:MAG: hypothetical protein Q8Q90_01985 [bacterium]|nr:hypothetical protein [bacterium]